MQIYLSFAPGEDALREQLAALVNVAGVSVEAAYPGGPAPQFTTVGGLAQAPREAVLLLFGTQPCPELSGRTALRLPEDAEQLLTLLQTSRPGGRITVVRGVRGGVGATLTALTLARAQAAQARGSVTFVDASGAGALREILGEIDGPPAPLGATWEAALAAPGPVLAERLVGTLPKWKGVEVLAGNIGAAPATPEVNATVAGILRALYAQGRQVVIDVGRSLHPGVAGFLTGRDYAQWIVSGEDLADVAEVRGLLAASTPSTRLAVWGQTGSGGAWRYLRELARAAGVPPVRLRLGARRGRALRMGGFEALSWRGKWWRTLNRAAEVAAS